MIPRDWMNISLHGLLSKYLFPFLCHLLHSKLNHLFAKSFTLTFRDAQP